MIGNELGADNINKAIHYTKKFSEQSRLKDVIRCPADIHGYPCAGGAEVILMNTKLLEVMF